MPLYLSKFSYTPETWARLIANPEDDAAFLRVVNFPTRGIGARALEQLQDTSAASSLSLGQAAAKLSGKAGTSVGAFVRMIDAMRNATAGLPLSEVVA